MKIRYYADLWPGVDSAQYPPALHYAPNWEKTVGCVRVAVDVEFPDSLIARLANKVDVVLPEPARAVAVDPPEGGRT